LEADIVANGCRDALIIARWQGQTVLADGHNRFEICCDHGIPFEKRFQDFEDRREVEGWIKKNQLARRNVTDDQRAIIAEEVAEGQAKVQKHQRARKAAAASHGLSLVSSGKQKRDTRNEIAKQYKIARRELDYARELRRDSPELHRRVRAGEITMIDAMREKRQAAKREAVENLATKQTKEVDGVFDVIVIDPPWPIDRIGQGSVYGLGAGAPLVYPVTTVEGIEKLVGEKLSKHADQNCHIFLWTVQRMMPDAFRLLDEWGLKYSFTMVWRKVTKTDKTVGPKPTDRPRYNGEFVL
jgi:hypothetical protein